MEHIYPSYYKDFHCIADRCPDSCCHEWDVQIDAATAQRYRQLEGDLGAALRRAMYQEDGNTYLRNQDNRCPMWQRDGLCRVQCALGHDALSQVCQEFPRIRQDYGNFIEHGLEMSCPEAARIMLTAEDWTFSSVPASDSETPDYDEEVMAVLKEARPAAFALMRDTDAPVNHRLALLLMYGYHIQAQIDGAEEVEFDPIAALTEAKGFAGKADFSALLSTFGGLEILTQRWRDTLAQSAPRPTWAKELCQLAQYGIYRYFYQSVSDYDLVCRIKFIVTNCIMVAYLGGGDTASQIACAQLLSKEIENDSVNMDALLDGAYTSPGLTDANLLALLLS